MTIVAWVNDDGQCLDERCNARGNWDGRALYCSQACFLADGHKGCDYSGDDPDAHTETSVFLVLEPGSCEHCEHCDVKVVQGVTCDSESCCDGELTYDQARREPIPPSKHTHEGGQDDMEHDWRNVKQWRVIACMRCAQLKGDSSDDPCLFEVPRNRWWIEVRSSINQSREWELIADDGYGRR
jgi:hypothetical protein